MPTTIEPAGTDWPFQVMEQDYHDGRNVWREVPEAFYWYGLEVLPPVYVAGGFMVGEPYTHNAEGYAVRALFTDYQGGYFARYATKREAPAMIQELRALFAPVTA